jgi:L-threonylcarbamoyladenylate synthase
MEVLIYTPAAHKKIIARCVQALKQGKTIVYPTDTSYGIACDITNASARARFYKIKERTPKQPVHIIMPSQAWAKKIALWDKNASALAQAFWPGPLSLILPLKQKSSLLPEYLKIISAGTGTVGLRLPNNKVALSLAHMLGRPIPATSANPSGHASKGYDSYSSSDVIKQFSRKKYKPDIIIDAGQLPKRKPSTLVKIGGNKWEIIRPGPITKKQIQQKINDSQA